MREKSVEEVVVMSAKHYVTAEPTVSKPATSTEHSASPEPSAYTKSTISTKHSIFLSFLHLLYSAFCISQPLHPWRNLCLPELDVYPEKEWRYTAIKPAVQLLQIQEVHPVPHSNACNFWPFLFFFSYLSYLALLGLHRPEGRATLLLP